MTNGTPTPAGGETPPAEVPPPATGTIPPGSGETPPTTIPQVSLDAALKEIESLKAALKRTNAESAAHRTKANELDKLKADIEAAKLSETEKLQKQLTDLQAKYDAESEAAFAQVVANEVYRAAIRHNIIDPDVAARLLNWDELDVDNAGKLTNVDKLLQDLVKDKPYLVAGKQQAPSASSGGATNPARSQTSGTGAAEAMQLLRSGKLSKEDYARLPQATREEMQRLMR